MNARWIKHGVSLLGALLFASCATAPKVTESPAATNAPTTAQVSKENAPKETGGETKQNDAISQVIAAETKPAEETPPRSADEIENLTIDEVIRIEEPNTANLYDNSRYDFPITMNSRVEGWIDYFTGRGRPHMERYLSRSSRYIPAMKQILKKAGMPEDLVYLALIESGFNLKAKSRARAVGPWQFMKATGQRYGLRVDAWIDERRDPLKSTEAAARYLKDLYLMFESWYLAASAYNAGEYKVLRAIEELKTNNYWRICETRMLRRETKDYIPKLISAAIIAKNPARYGFDEVIYEEPLEFDVVSIGQNVRLSEIAKIADVTPDELDDLNPQFRRGMVPPGTTTEVRIPVGSRALVERALANLGKGSTPMPVQYTVRSGDTLQSVSRRYHLNVRDLANANNMSPKERPQPGSTLLIPSKKEAIREFRREVASAAPESGFIFHTVERGESIWSIAEKYNVTVQDIFRWNNLHRSRIEAGKRLKVKVNNGNAEEGVAPHKSVSKRS